MANKHFKSLYPSNIYNFFENILLTILIIEMLEFQTIDEYIGYYENLNIELDNFSNGTKKSHC